MSMWIGFKCHKTIVEDFREDTPEGRGKDNDDEDTRTFPPSPYLHTIEAL